MCTKIGVDPLQSNKGFWAEILGVGDFYYELGVQIIEVCIALREKTGGLVELDDLQARIEKMRGKLAQEITQDDLVRAIKSIQPLGGGYELINLGKRKLVQSVPREVSGDFTTILTTFQSVGNFTVSDVSSQLGWDSSRVQRVIV